MGPKDLDPILLQAARHQHLKFNSRGGEGGGEGGGGGRESIDRKGLNPACGLQEF